MEKYYQNGYNINFKLKISCLITKIRKPHNNLGLKMASPISTLPMIRSQSSQDHVQTPTIIPTVHEGFLDRCGILHSSAPIKASADPLTPRAQMIRQIANQSGIGLRASSTGTRLGLVSVGIQTQSPPTAQEIKAKLDSLVKDANGGDQNAQYSLASAYKKGRLGLEQLDPEERSKCAAQWYDKAARQGHAKAQFNLACFLSFYAECRGSEKSESENKAVDCFRQTIQNQSPQALKKLAKQLQRHVDCAQELNEQKLLLEKGAAHWYAQAVKQGYAKAQYNLAHAYLEGKGVETSVKKAVILFQLAAAQGYKDAALALGHLAEQNLGGLKSTDAAHWFARASILTMFPTK